VRSLPTTVIVVGLVCWLASCAASWSSPQGIAAGVQGIGKQWPSGTPTIRWWVNGANAIEAIGSFSYEHSVEANAYYSTYNSGLELSWVRSLQYRSGFQAGLRIGVDYHDVFTHSTIENERDYSLALSVGPDFEYFLPILPRMSIGAHAMARIKFRETGWRTSAAHNFYESTYVEILGQMLNVRYYF
jgi:hypothetical protein